MQEIIKLIPVLEGLPLPHWVFLLVVGLVVVFSVLTLLANILQAFRRTIEEGEATFTKIRPFLASFVQLAHPLQCKWRHSSSYHSATLEYREPALGTAWLGYGLPIVVVSALIGRGLIIDISHGIPLRDTGEISFMMLAGMFLAVSAMKGVSSLVVYVAGGDDFILMWTGRYIVGGLILGFAPLFTLKYMTLHPQVLTLTFTFTILVLVVSIQAANWLYEALSKRPIDPNL